MDKYGVDTKQPDEKQASGGCPKCGTPREKLRYEGSVLLCPNCGSEPFEEES